ncbi:unnamed protein product [Ambrosiozyma monospora]|uniref:U6 snRNA-associated Sm-like protein LSm1 n=1 Tax=Ambrosiozyma monospora TaxID=43982 RepID=A0A9W7DG77_AMBMO|nr:unnamed protein product [Ambrosiozyma monospora]
MSQPSSGGSNIEDLYLQSYSFTTAAAIIGSVDRKVFVLLRDGKTLFGVLRTFDQFANLVLHDGIERIYLQETKEYAESEKPELYVIRGENVVMVGELDIDKEDEAIKDYKKIDFKKAQTIWNEERKAAKLEHFNESEIFHKKGLALPYLNTTF